MSRVTRPTIKILVSLILMPLLSGCAYLQYFGLFPSTGTVEDGDVPVPVELEN